MMYRSLPKVHTPYLVGLRLEAVSTSPWEELLSRVDAETEKDIEKVFHRYIKKKIIT